MQTRFRKVLLFSVVLSLLLANVVLISNCSKEEPQVYKIGAILPLTGSGASWGDISKKGIMLAEEEINQAGGIKGKKIEVLFEDSKTEPNGAISALRKLIDIHKVPCSVVDMISSNVLAIAPIAEEKQVVIISPGASSPDISNAGEYVFRNWPSDDLQGSELAKIVYEKGYKKIAILYIENAFGEGLKKAFTNTFEGNGGAITAAEPFEQGGSDFRPQVTKVKGSNPEAVILFIYPPEAVKLIKQIREAGISVQLFATAEIEDPSVLEIKEAEGLIYSMPQPPDKGRKEVSDFIAAYKAKYNEDPGVISDVAYDALKLLCKGIEEGGYSGPAIQKVLSGVIDYKGTSGTITFDENGDLAKPIIAKTIKDGKFTVLSEG